MKTIIKNARVIDPSQNLDQVAHVYMARGRIQKIGDTPPENFKADLEIEARDHWVLPGLIDLKASLGEPGNRYAGSIQSETKAAVRGGITSICCPPDTSPVNDTQAVTELILRRARQAATAYVMPLGALTQDLAGARLSNSFSLKQAGCVALSQANLPLGNALTLKNALDYNATMGMPIMLRCEDQQLKNRGVAHTGAVSSRLGLPAIPPAAETAALARDLMLVEESGAQAHFSQISCARSVELIAEAKKRGLKVTCDVAIHQLILSEMDILGFNSVFHVSPPLRDQRDKNALLAGVKAGIIDAIVSDHTPLDKDEKLLPFGESAPGISGLETLLALVLKLVDSQQLDLLTALRALTQNPANILGVSRGHLKVGGPADLTIVDPSAIWTLTPQTMLSAGKNTPFAGWEFEGQVKHTFFQGRCVFSANKTTNT